MSGPVVIANLPKGRGEVLRVAIDRYRQVDLIDLRICAELTATSGIQTPTKRGVALRVEQIPELIAALEAAKAEAQRRGLLDG